jgi:hypothetical protein
MSKFTATAYQAPIILNLSGTVSCGFVIKTEDGAQVNEFNEQGEASDESPWVVINAPLNVDEDTLDLIMNDDVTGMPRSREDQITAAIEMVEAGSNAATLLTIAKGSHYTFEADGLTEVTRFLPARGMSAERPLREMDNLHFASIALLNLTPQRVSLPKSTGKASKVARYVSASQRLLQTTSEVAIEKLEAASIF